MTQRMPSARRPSDEERPDRSLPTLLIWAFVVLAVLQAVYYYPKMPESMATHFASGGQPNGWSNRTSYVFLNGLMQALMVAFGFGLAWVIRRLPSRFVNIPHRELWLERPHRERTIGELTVWTRWLGALTLAFLISTTQFVYAANLGGGDPRLGSGFMVALAAFIAAVIWMVFLLYRRFGRPPSR